MCTHFRESCRTVRGAEARVCWDSVKLFRIRMDVANSRGALASVTYKHSCSKAKCRRDDAASGASCAYATRGCRDSAPGPGEISCSYSLSRCSADTPMLGDKATSICRMDSRTYSCGDQNIATVYQRQSCDVVQIKTGAAYLPAVCFVSSHQGRMAARSPLCACHQQAGLRSIIPCSDRLNFQSTHGFRQSFVD